MGIFNVYTQELNMRTRVKKWGNSLGLRIPKTFADEINLKENSSIEMMMQEGTLLITPVTEHEWTLEELLAGVTDENRHHEWETGPAEGEETW
jgi:antitoxin MazE